MTNWPEFHFRVGDKVQGANCNGAPFTGTVERVPSPWTVVLDDGRWTPVSLITSFDRPAEKPRDEPKGQLSLF